MILEGNIWFNAPNISLRPDAVVVRLREGFLE